MKRITKHDIDLGFYVDENGYHEERWHSNKINQDIFVIQGDAVSRLGELEDMLEEGKLVEVVRCEECKHRGDCQKRLLAGYWDDAVPRTVDMSYCSYGERGE